MQICVISSVPHKNRFEKILIEKKSFGGTKG
jgi:hypothetical protein